MSDRPVTVIADQLANNLVERLTAGPRWVSSDAIAEILNDEARNILDALKAARIAVVELPAEDEPMSDVVQRAKNALDGTTPGPWEATWEDADQWWSVTAGPIDNMVCPEVTTVDGRPADAEFIMAARTLVPELVAEVEQLRVALNAECQAADNAERQVRDYERGAR